MQSFSDLNGKILIASPYAMEDNVFHKSMIYVIQHSQNGSAGLIFNRPLKNLPADTLFKKVNDQLNLPDLDLEVHIGGPIELERGFFMHSMDYGKNLLFKPQDEIIGVSSNTDIINDLANGAGPEKAIFIIGYTGWGAGQLEFELENNLWIVAEPEKDLVFGDLPSIKWDLALSALGISPKEFIPSAGCC